MEKGEIKFTTNITYVKNPEISFKQVNEYIYLKNLGSGGFGKVKLVKNQSNNKFYAMKIYKKNWLKKQIIFSSTGKFSNAYQSVLKEIEVLSKINHPNLIRLFEVLNEEKNDKLYLILELAHNGPLMKYDEKEKRFCFSKKLKRFLEILDFNDKQEFFYELFLSILDGVAYLHNQNILHLDINPQNIVLDKNFNPKIIDFNSSVILDPICECEQRKCIYHFPKNESKRIMEADIIYSTKGTFIYCCPESLSKSKNLGFSGRKADIWNLGLLLYNLIFENHPFEIHENILINERFWKLAKAKISKDLKGEIIKKIKKKLLNNQKLIYNNGIKNENSNIDKNIEDKKNTEQKKNKNNIFGVFLNLFKNKIRKNEKNEKDFFLEKNLNIIHDLLQIDPNKRKELKKLLAVHNKRMEKGQKYEISPQKKLLRKYFNELRSNIGCIGNEAVELNTEFLDKMSPQTIPNYLI